MTYSKVGAEGHSRDTRKANATPLGENFLCRTEWLQIEHDDILWHAKTFFKKEHSSRRTLAQPPAAVVSQKVARAHAVDATLRVTFITWRDTKTKIARLPKMNMILRAMLKNDDNGADPMNEVALRRPLHRQKQIKLSHEYKTNSCPLLFEVHVNKSAPCLSSREKKRQELLNSIGCPGSRIRTFVCGWVLALSCSQNPYDH